MFAQWLYCWCNLFLEMSFLQLKEAAEEIGLEGHAVATFIKEQQDAARNERALERAHELEIAKLRADTPQPAVAPVDQFQSAKLPNFRDGDDIKSFIVRFERVAHLINLDPGSYAVRMGTLLSGKALDIYASLPVDTTANFDLLKRALLNGFNKGPDSYRTEFRNSRIAVGETYRQFSDRLNVSLKYWLEAKSVGSSYTNLFEFVLFDQFLASLSPELRTFIKENDVNTLAQAVSAADSWSNARNAYPKEKSKKFYSKSSDNSGSNYNQILLPPKSQLTL